MIFAGDKAGNPWHGTWTDDGLTLPNDSVLDIPVAVDGGPNGWPAFYPITEPNLTTIGPRHGDCLLVRIPDLGAPETSAAEESLGMTWLNYTLISGANRLLYGVPIGKACWVYLDSDDRPWLVEILPLLEGTTTWRFRFFSRLIFGETDAEIIVGFENDTEAEFTVDAIVYDASETGRSVAWGIHYDIEPYPHWLTPSVTRFVLSGTPGVDLEVSEGVAETILSDPDLVWGTGGYWYAEEYPAGHWSNTSLLPPYWIFDGDDAISLRYVIDYDCDAWVLSEPGGLHNPRTLEGTISVLTPFGSFDVAFTSIVSEPASGYYAYSFETDDWSYSYSDLTPGDESSGFVPNVYTVRQTNKVVEVFFSAVFWGGGNGDGIEAFSVCRILPDRFEATGVTTTIDQILKHMTYHPVTKELLESSAPVCFM